MKVNSGEKWPENNKNLMPVRGSLGTSWAQFRHNLGTNDFDVLQMPDFK